MAVFCQNMKIFQIRFTDNRLQSACVPKSGDSTFVDKFLDKMLVSIGFLCGFVLFLGGFWSEMRVICGRFGITCVSAYGCILILCLIIRGVLYFINGFL